MEKKICPKCGFTMLQNWCIRCNPMKTVKKEHQSKQTFLGIPIEGRKTSPTYPLSKYVCKECGCQNTPIDRTCQMCKTPMPDYGMFPPIKPENEDTS